MDVSTPRSRGQDVIAPAATPSQPAPIDTSLSPTSQPASSAVPTVQTPAPMASAPFPAPAQTFSFPNAASAPSLFGQTHDLTSQSFGTVDAFDTPASHRAKIRLMVADLNNEATQAVGARRQEICGELEKLWDAMGYSINDNAAAARVILTQVPPTPSVLGMAAGQTAPLTQQGVPSSTGGESTSSFEHGLSQSGVSLSASFGASPKAPETSSAVTTGSEANQQAPARATANISAEISSSSAQPPTLPQTVSDEQMNLASPSPQPGLVPSPPVPAPGGAQAAPTTFSPSTTSDHTQATLSEVPPGQLGNTTQGLADQKVGSPVPAATDAVLLDAPKSAEPAAAEASTPFESSQQEAPAAFSQFVTQEPFPPQPSSATADSQPEAAAQTASVTSQARGEAPGGASLATTLHLAADADVSKWRSSIDKAAQAVSVPANLLASILFEHGEGVVGGSSAAADKAKTTPLMQANQQLFDYAKTALPNIFENFEGEGERVLGVAAHLRAEFERQGSWELAAQTYVSNLAKAAPDQNNNPIEDVARSTQNIMAWWRGLSTGQELSPSHEASSIR